MSEYAYRVTLPNGIVIECDSLTDMLSVINAVYPEPVVHIDAVDIDSINRKLERVIRQ